MDYGKINEGIRLFEALTVLKDRGLITQTEYDTAVVKVKAQIKKDLE